MKKISVLVIVLVLIIAMSLMLVACNDDSNTDSENNENIESEKVSDDKIEDKPTETTPNNPISAESMEKINAIYGKATIEPQTIKSVHDLAIMTSVNYKFKGEGPIGVAAARLNGEDITLIVLGGTEDVEGQATSIRESKLASQGKDNDYLTAVVKLFENDTIPKDKPVLIAGISLGGMIAQQLIEKVSYTYEVAAVVTFGSPFTRPLERNSVKTVRFVDSNDMVPKLGESTLWGVDTSALDTVEKIIRTSKYTGMVDPHALSYIEDECWNDFDFLGDTAKSNTLVTLEKLTYYAAPKLGK